MTTKSTKKSASGGRVKLQTSATARAVAAGGKPAGRKKPGAKPSKKPIAKASARSGKSEKPDSATPKAKRASPVSSQLARSTAATGKAAPKTKSLATKAGKTSQLQKAKKASKASPPTPEMSVRDKERRELALTGAELAIELALDKKAVGPVLIDVSSQASYTDYIGIVSGRSDRQVEAIADHVATTMKSQGWTLVGREGTSNGRWTLLDFGDLILHIFYHPVRDVYDIEGLWVGAPRVPLKNVPPEALHFQPDALYAQP